MYHWWFRFFSILHPTNGTNPTRQNRQLMLVMSVFACGDSPKIGGPQYHPNLVHARTKTHGFGEVQLWRLPQT